MNKNINNFFSVLFSQFQREKKLGERSELKFCLCRLLYFKMLFSVAIQAVQGQFPIVNINFKNHRSLLDL